MLLVADVHGAFESLAAVASGGEPILILGDLVNFVDYRTHEGILADVFGTDFVAEVSRLRGSGEYAAARDLWRRHAADREDELRAMVVAGIRRQYQECRAALDGAVGFATFGNVDWPELMAASLPKGMRFVDGDVVEIGGWGVGFVGGGAETPIRGRGEVTDDAMRAKLSELGPVDVLCSHLPPAVLPVQTDVVTGRSERGSVPILEYLREHRPAYHFFGDVHQPQASRWRLGSTELRNVGYFRATGRAVRFEA